MATEWLIDDFQALFEACGGTDVLYLRHHFQRYAETKRKLLTSWDRGRGNAILDIGAHWLHQAMLYATDGFAVTALDMPVTLEFPSVKALAEKHGISLVPSDDLERATAFEHLGDDSFDLVLFTEIIEHITFNPVALWKEIYRVTKPGGRIVITTPNYYAWRGRTWEWGRFLKRFGGGITVLDILDRRTYGHHWKEFSLRELIYYFCVLSPDFNCVNATHVEEYRDGYLEKRAGPITRWLESTIPILRPDVYAEFEIREKAAGIVVVPEW